MNNVQIQSIVNEFVGKLQHVWNQSVVDALGGVSVGKKGRGSANATSNGRAKGEKRSSDELEAIKEKFVAFVSRKPGLRIEQINKELGTNTKDLALPIRQLVSDGVIKQAGSKRSTTYKAK